MTELFALPIIDALLAVLPVGDAALGVEKDDSASQPAHARPKKLYAWPMRVGPQVLADVPQGRVSDTFLRVAVLYTLGAKGEPRVLRRERQISEALDAWVGAALAALYAGRRSAHWWDAYTESITYDATRSDEVRSVGMTVVLRINTPPAIGE